MKIVADAKRVLWYEVIAFTVIILAIWVGSFLPLFRGQRGALEWEDPILETAVILLVAVPTLIYSKRILGHLHHLEGMLRICAWCHRVKVGDQWIPVEDFLKRRLSTQTSHGICESCTQQFRHEIEQRRRS